MSTEKNLMDRIRATLCEIDGVRVWRNNSGLDTTRGVRYGLGVGSPDLVGIAWGRFIGLEVKTPTGRITREQRAWIDTITRLGGVAAVVRSVDEAVTVAMGAKW
jgi:hypothetical protein